MNHSNDNPKRLPFKLELPDSLVQAIALLEKAGGVARVVGGSVRDALLGLEPKDFDVEVYGLELEQVADILNAVGKSVMTGKSFCVVKLRVDEDEYDFSIPRKETKSGSGHRGFDIEPEPHLSEREASSRRDLTINALHYDALSSEILDFNGGLKDLNNRVLRHTSDAFREDPLRPLRAMQFASRFDFALHPETARICQSLKSEYHTLPIERIWVEWEKWTSKSKRPSAGLKALLDMGWLDLYPELDALRGVPQEPEWHPEGDVWAHTLHCVDAMVELDIWKHASKEERSILLLAILCHDLGKPQCTERMLKDGQMRWTSHGHAMKGVPIAERFMERIGVFSRIAQPVLPLVQLHHFLMNAKDGGPSNSSLRRLTRKLQPANALQLAAVMTADALGRPPLLNEEKVNQIQQFTERVKDLNLEQKAPEPILMGRHLIALGLEPGVQFKPILDAAFQAQLDGVFTNSDEGVAWVRTNGYISEVV